MDKKKAGESLSAIEETQTALRSSIEQAKNLAAESERLIKKHRNELEGES